MPENTTGKILSRVTQLLQKADEIRDRIDVAVKQLEELAKQADDDVAKSIYREIARLESASEAWSKIEAEIVHILTLLYDQNERLYEGLSSSVSNIEKSVTFLDNSLIGGDPNTREMLLELTDRDKHGVKLSKWALAWHELIAAWRKNILWVISLFVLYMLYQAIAEPVVTSVKGRFTHHGTQDANK